MPNHEIAVTLENITHWFKKQEPVLDHVNLKLRSGDIHGFTGNNGSGKTLLFKVICGYLHPKEGKVIVHGNEIGRHFDFPPEMGLLLEAPGFLTSLNAYDNLSLLWSLRGKPDKKRIHEIIDFVGLCEHKKKRVGTYSLGMRQRLGIAQAIMENPKLLILDEPFNGLDKHGVKEIHELILSLKGQGITVLLSSHMPGDMTLLCDSVHEMEAGKLT